MQEQLEQLEMCFADFEPIDELLSPDLAYLTEEQLAEYRRKLSLTSTCAMQMKMSLKDVEAELTPMAVKTKARRAGKPVIVVDLDF